MSRLTPTIMYALTIIMLFWLVIGAITLPNASRWFKGRGPSIRQELIVLLANNGTSTSQEWQYNANVMTTDNVPFPPTDGIQGTLYDSDDGCSSIVSNETLPNATATPTRTGARIALIRRGNCLFMEKLLNARKDGASAAIVYDNVSFDQDPIASTGMYIQPSVIPIPAYYVDLAVGMDLQARLTNVTPTSFTRVTLFPPQRARLDPWQFALIVIGLVVVTTIAVLVAVQCHLWRTGQGSSRSSQRGRNDDDNNEAAAVEELYWRLTVSATALPAHIRLSPEAVDALPVRLATDEGKDQTCVICLESYVAGDAIKTLPCQHEYHKDCIDPWLAKKSASCPLCLQTVYPPPTLPPQIHPAPERPNDIEMASRPLFSDAHQGR